MTIWPAGVCRMVCSGQLGCKVWSGSCRRMRGPRILLFRGRAYAGRMRGVSAPGGRVCGSTSTIYAVNDNPHRRRKSQPRHRVSDQATERTIIVQSRALPSAHQPEFLSPTACNSSARPKISHPTGVRKFEPLSSQERKNLLAGEVSQLPVYLLSQLHTWPTAFH